VIGLGKQYNHNTILDLDTGKYLKAQRKEIMKKSKFDEQDPLYCYDLLTDKELIYVIDRLKEGAESTNGTRLGPFGKYVLIDDVIAYAKKRREISTEVEVTAFEQDNKYANCMYEAYCPPGGYPEEKKKKGFKHILDRFRWAIVGWAHKITGVPWEENY